jgi:hypothetical protein
MLVPLNHEMMLRNLVGGGGLRIILLPSILLSNSHQHGDVQ